MNTISTHILDTSKGKPAEGVTVTLAMRDQDSWRTVGQGKTNSDGRISEFAADDGFHEGEYELIFSVESYLKPQKKYFYRQIKIGFIIGEGNQHYHVPLLLNPFGYSTYRGS